jgi:Carboxypeptidase regulatory-like domain
MRMKKRKKRIGTSLLLLVATLLPGAAAAKKKPEPDTYAMISGSVFQESGYALPEAAITLIAQPASGSTAAKAQKLEAVSDARGEFIVRVPPGPTNYTIVVAAKGYQIMRKSVMVEGLERVEVTFQLERESK